VEIHSRKGDPADALLAVAKDTNAELIVVGN
jgi:nucleotide-binding universal stress UspA family protein